RLAALHVADALTLPPDAVNVAALFQPQLDPVLGLTAPRTMFFDDFHEPIENSGPASVLSAGKLLPYAFTVRRMASLEPQLQLASRLRVRQSLARDLGVLPTKHKTVIRRAKAAP